MGREIPNQPEDPAKNLVNLVNYLMPPFQLGNQPGDAERYDHKGNLLIIKEEPRTSSSESDENTIIEINPQGTANPVPASQEAGKKPGGEGTRIPVLCAKCSAEEKEDEEPVPSTSKNIKKQSSTDATIGPFPGRIEIDGLAMAQFFARFFKEYDLTIAPKTGKIAGVWYPDGQKAPEDQVPETTDPSTNGATQDLTRKGKGSDTHASQQDLDQQAKQLQILQGMAQSRRAQEESKIVSHEQDEQEPEITDPDPLDRTIHCVENIIQMLDDHIAVSPNPAQASSEKETDSGLEEPLTHEQENKDDSDSENGIIDVVATLASDTENQEIEVVATSSSDPDEINIVDPTNTETCPEAGAQTPTSNRGSETTKENNNNQEEEKATLELPTNWQLPSQTPRKQLLLHRVPISFPVPSNLMESMDSLMFIQEALLSLVEDLPGDALVDATPLHRVNSYQAKTAVILTFDAEQTRE